MKDLSYFEIIEKLDRIIQLLEMQNLQPIVNVTGGWCKHEWISDGGMSTVSHWRCVKCGTVKT
jgi:hypothetical protein